MQQVWAPGWFRVIWLTRNFPLGDDSPERQSGVSLVIEEMNDAGHNLAAANSQGERGVGASFSTRAVTIPVDNVFRLRRAPDVAAPGNSVRT